MGESDSATSISDSGETARPGANSHRDAVAVLELVGVDSRLQPAGHPRPQDLARLVAVEGSAVAEDVDPSGVRRTGVEHRARREDGLRRVVLQQAQQVWVRRQAHAAMRRLPVIDEVSPLPLLDARGDDVLPVAVHEQRRIDRLTSERKNSAPTSAAVPSEIARSVASRAVPNTSCMISTLTPRRERHGGRAARDA